MATISDGVRSFLEAGPLGHVVTLEADGTPHVSVAWAGVDGDEIVWASFSDQHKIDNLRRDPRVTISFLAPTYGGEGLWPYLVIGGTARIDDGGALAVMDRLAEFYIGPGAVYPWRDAPPGLVIHVTVERIYGQGPWREE